MNRRKFLHSSGGLLAAAGLSSLLAWTPRTALARAFGPPHFSADERKRRWANTRALMAEHGLDALIVPHGAGDTLHEYAAYLSEGMFMNPGAVLMPAKGDPLVFGHLGPPAWIKQVVPTGEVDLGSALVNAINDLGLAKARLGVVGVESGVLGLNEFTNDGLITYHNWNAVLTGLKEAKFKDITGAYAEMMLVKSAEEIEHFRGAATVGERLHEMMLAEIKPGLAPPELFAKIKSFFARQGAMTNVEALMLFAPIRMGQVIPSEYGYFHRGGYAQVTLSVAVGKLSKKARALADVAEASLALALETIKPGRTFREAVQPLEKLVADAGYQHGFPQVHSLSPIVLAGPVGKGMMKVEYTKYRGGEVVLKPGMFLSLENGARTSPMEEVRVGGTLMVTETGVEMLNTLGTKLRLIEAPA